MPVLEVTQLRLKGIPADDPTLLKSLSTVRGTLQTNSQFYHCVEDPTLIFVLGVWPTLDAHLDFLASPARDEVLGPQEDLLEFRWTLHMELDAMSSLPLDAPVLAIMRLLIKGDRVNAYDQAAAKDMHIIADYTHPHNVVNGWRYDAAPGTHEALVFTGWESAHAHAAFAEKAGDNTKFPAIEGVYESMEVWHARNMEK